MVFVSGDGELLATGWQVTELGLKFIDMAIDNAPVVL
jgi:hypothetical protein